MKKSLILCILFCMVAGLTVWAAEGEKEKTTAKETPKERIRAIPKEQAPGRPGRPTPRGPVDRQQVYQQMRAKQAEQHAKSVAELVAIKAIAEEEGATRTAEAIQKMIDKMNDEYKKRIQRTELKRRERDEQMKLREGRERPSKIAEEKPTEPAEEK